MSTDSGSAPIAHGAVPLASAPVVWLLWWAGALGVWLLLVGSLDPAEVGLGVIAAAIAASGVWLVRRQDGVTFALRWSYLGLLLARLPAVFLRDVARVLKAVLLRLRGTRIHGHLAPLPFDPGADDDPFAASRRALVVAGVFLTPNTVVVRVDARAHILYVHQLRPTDPPQDRAWPL